MDSGEIASLSSLSVKTNSVLMILLITELTGPKRSFENQLVADIGFNERQKLFSPGEHRVLAVEKNRRQFHFSNAQGMSVI